MGLADTPIGAADVRRSWARLLDPDDPSPLASLLAEQGYAAPTADPLAARASHFTPRAKNCILIYFEGAPSHIDLFDPKPKLNELHGQKLPDSMLEKVRFAFIKKEGVRLMGSPRKFTKHGQCGMELSDLLPHIGSIADDICLVRSMNTTQFNHHPGQLMLQCGAPLFGRPTMGSWLAYGLGSESQNLPGYVVLTAGRGTSGGASLWSSGFLPSNFAGTLFRNQGDPVLNLSNPPGITPEMQAGGLGALNDLNRIRHERIHDPEIASRIAAYELAFRMQTSAPELMDLSGEPQQLMAAADAAIGRALVNALGGSRFRPYLSDDPIGAQIGHLVRGGCTLAPDAYLFTVIDRAILADEFVERLRTQRLLDVLAADFGGDQAGREAHDGSSMEGMDLAAFRSKVSVLSAPSSRLRIAITASGKSATRPS